MPSSLATLASPLVAPPWVVEDSLVALASSLAAPGPLRNGTRPVHAIGQSPFSAPLICPFIIGTAKIKTEPRKDIFYLIFGADPFASFYRRFWRGGAREDAKELIPLSFVSE